MKRGGARGARGRGGRGVRLQAVIFSLSHFGCLFVFVLC
jgi:hypothetical protein